ncbi:MAG: ATPase [Phenylobacterium sp.]|nr:ATPase [Phenylobacterium sp.]
MSQTITPAAIRKTLEVRATPQKAFQVFTDGIDRWWPKDLTISKAPLKQVVIEPRVGGRWYGIDVDGAEDDWGDVLAWEPPGRLLLAWRISSKWVCDPSVHTEVEVTFTDLGDGRCRVDFEHRDLANLGEGADTAAVNMDSGWGGILGRFKAVAEA